MNAEQLPIFYDMFNMICGEKIGAGIHRTVYHCKVRPELVVKVDHDTNYRDFANVREMKFWDDNQYYKPVADWLAPCEFLSPDGRVMLQMRCDPIPQNYQLPEKLPAFLTDIKPQNFGLLNGRLVCFDYALHIANPSTRLKKAFW